MENNYLIPANSKRGKLILGYFRPIDFILFGSGAGLTLLLLMIFQSNLNNITTAIVILLPVLITGFLVLPLGTHYHNVLVFLTNMINFYFNNRRFYIWKGWCNKYYEEESNSK